jgi:hypothetical protein
MPRTLTSGVQTAIAAELGALTHLLEFDFSGGTLWITTAPTGITATVPYPDGTSVSHAFSAIGGTCEFDAVNEGTGPGEGNTQVTLSGVDLTVIAALLTSGVLGRNAYVWRAYFDANWAIVSAPALLFCGIMNADWELEEQRPVAPGQAGTAVIRTRLTDLFSDFDQVRGIQTNLASHQSQPEQPTPATTESLFANDTFFQFVASMMWKRMQWAGQIFSVSPSLPYQERGGASTLIGRAHR